MGWLVRNWHLKLSAVLLAMILYTGFVYSDSFSEQQFPGAAIQAINQPAGTYLLTQQLGTVDVRYRIAADANLGLNPDSFVVSVDLRGYDMDRAPEPQSLPVQVQPFSEGVDVLEWTPETVAIQLDHLDEKAVRIVVDRGAIPEGLEIGSPAVDPRQVTARGPRSLLGRVDHAVARVAIDQSGIDVSNRSVTLVPVDAEGREVDAVDLDPETATVDIDVSTVETTKTVAVVPLLTGTPAAGFEIGTVTVNPPVVTLRGMPPDLVGVEQVTTQPISLAGASSTQRVPLELVLPPGTLLADEDEAPMAVVQVREQSATRTYLIGPVCVGAAADLVCLPQQGQVAVRLGGSAATLDAIAAADLNAVLDVAGLGAGSHTVTVTFSLPEGTTLVSIQPPSVPVIMQAPATPTPAPTPAA